MHSALRTATRTALARPSSAFGPSFRLASRPELANHIQSRTYAGKNKKKKGPVQDPDAAATDAARESPANHTTGEAEVNEAAAEAAAVREVTPKAAPPSSDASQSQAELEGSRSLPESSTALPISSSPQSLSLDFAPPDPTEKDLGGQTGARSSKDSLSSIERRQRRMARLGFFGMALGALATVAYMGREWDVEELKDKRLTLETAPNGRYGRTVARFSSLFDFFSEPAWPELLPPPFPAANPKPYTLLLSLDDLLVTSTWDRQHGWRTVKRPGVDYFIAYLSQFYEIVIFTTQQSFTALPIVEKLDPYTYFIAYRLFREATRMGKDGPVKDLSYLNRPLEKVIVLDAHPEHVVANPENAVILKPWKGERGDKGLIEIIPFLESIGIYKPDDIRPILKAYEGTDIPREYALREAADKQALIAEWKARGGGKGLSGGDFTISSLFSGKQQQGPAMPETFLEKKRREAQQYYLSEQKYLQDNKAEIERMMREEAEAQQKAMGGTIFGMMAGFGGKPPQDSTSSSTPTASSSESGSVTLS